MQVNKKRTSKFHIIYLGIFIIPFQYLLDSKVFTFAIIGISFFSMLFLIRREITIPITYFSISYLLLILFGLISTFYSGDPTSSYSILIEVIPYYFYCIILSWYILDNPSQTIEKVVKVLKTFVVGTLILTVFVLINDLNGFNKFTRIGNEVFGDKHTMFTYYLMISTCIAIWLYYKQIKKRKKITLAVMIIFLFTVSVFTAIRKAILIPIIFWVAYVFISSLDRKKLIKASLTVIIGVAFLLCLYVLIKDNEYFASTVGMRIQGFIAGLEGTGESDDSFNIRKQLAVTAIDCFKTHPFFGYGFGAFRDYAGKMIGIRLYAHNNYLELLASTGILGFSIFYGNIILIFKKLYQRFKNYKSTMYAFGMSFVISFLVNDFAVVSYLSLPFMVILSILASLCRFKINTNKENFNVKVDSE